MFSEAASYIYICTYIYIYRKVEGKPRTKQGLIAEDWKLGYAVGCKEELRDNIFIEQLSVQKEKSGILLFSLSLSRSLLLVFFLFLPCFLFVILLCVCLLSFVFVLVFSVFCMLY